MTTGEERLKTASHEFADVSEDVHATAAAESADVNAMTEGQEQATSQQVPPLWAGSGEKT